MTPDSMAALLALAGDDWTVTYAERDGRWQLEATPEPPVPGFEPLASDSAAGLAKLLREHQAASR